MKRRIITLLAACLMVISLAPVALALGPSDSGSCGEGLTWELEDHVLTISGSGEMEDGCPWEEYESSVERVVFTGGVTRIGEKAFYGFDSIESVDFGDALVEIGEQAFYGCDDIDYIHLPDTFRTFGAECFRDCASLKYVYCDGPMPSFKSSCLWTGSYISVFYRTDTAWPAESVRQLVSSFGGMMGIHMGNFEDAALTAEIVDQDEDEDDETEATEETEEATVETTEQTTDETIEAREIAEVVAESVTEPENEPTVVEAVPVTEPATVPATEPTTVPEETVPETTQYVRPEEEQQTPAEEVTGNSWIGMVLIAGVLTFFIAGALIFKIASRKGGRYTE